MQKTVGDIPGILNIRDDILCYGEDTASHNRALNNVLQRFNDCGLTLNKSKCQFNLDEVKFFGFIFSKDGVKQDPGKADIIQSLEAPKSFDEIRSLVSMVAFSARFIPGFSSINAPLRKLTEKNAKWQWGHDEEKALEKLRTALSKDITLQYYNKQYETRIYTDAGPNGLGAMLAQRKSGQDSSWRPILFVSRSLTKVEQRYSQIEKEALGVRWACERLYLLVPNLKL
ncbi:hypothetical protein SNE40_001661 [Patella caerulea]|uniref:Reverse transcriptase domain-containing protein n=1 Tax=Patella caerulea TaxID=87958 RepID=A0AAN8QBE6_PATCE